jgi:hypothetical protein
MALLLTPSRDGEFMPAELWICTQVDQTKTPLWQKVSLGPVAKGGKPPP